MLDSQPCSEESWSFKPRKEADWHILNTCLLKLSAQIFKQAIVFYLGHKLKLYSKLTAQALKCFSLIFSLVMQAFYLRGQVEGNDRLR